MRLVALLVMATAGLVHAQAPNWADPVAIGKRLDETLNAVTPAGLWGGVVVGKDGRVVYTKGFGGPDGKLGEVKADTLFDIGSISKQITAATILKLEMEGKLSTEAPVSQWFAVGGRATQVRLKHLLTHTSGMADEGAIQPLAFPDRDEAVRRALNSEFHSAPGEKWEYCNAGYIVLAAVIEKATGQTYEDAVRERLFGPAEMKDSGFLDGVGLDAERCSPRVTAMLGGGMRRVPLFTAPGGEPWAWGLRGAGGVVTTFEELVKWDRALAGEAVLSAAAKEKLLTPVLNGYAMGWEVSRTGVGRKASHSGRTRGFTAVLSRFIDQGVVVAVVTGEREDPYRLERSLVQALFPSEREGVAAELFVSDVKLGENRAGQVQGRAEWEVAPGAEVVAILTCDGKKLAVVRLAPASARRVAGELEALSGGAEPAGDRATVMLGLMPYEQKEGRVALPGHVGVMTLKAYTGIREDGSQVRDERPTLILVDEKAGFWPLIVRMDAGVAASLAQAIRGALGP